MKLTSALLTLLAAAYPILGADKLTMEKAMQVREPSDLQFSPDGKRVARRYCGSLIRRSNSWNRCSARRQSQSQPTPTCIKGLSCRS